MTDLPNVLPPYSPARQRARLMRILDEYARTGTADLRWAEDWADDQGRRTSKHGIVAANWNPDSFEPRVDNFLSHWARLMERLPSDEQVDMEWSDSVDVCGGCNNMIVTQPDHMWWQPAYMVYSGDIYCKACCLTGPEQVVEDLRREHGEKYMPELPEWLTDALRGGTEDK